MAPSPRDRKRGRAEGTPVTMDLTVGPVAAGGGCVARAEDGRVVFVRHTLPGERVLARVTAERASFLRADAVEVINAAPDRVAAPCPHAGPGRCGGCDWQHVAVPAQRALKADLVAEQLRRLANVDRRVEVEEVEGAPDGLGWRTRVQFAVDPSGRTGFHRHRSRSIQPVESCPIAVSAITGLGLGSARWRGARHLEVTASPAGGLPVVSVDAGRAESERHHRRLPPGWWSTATWSRVRAEPYSRSSATGSR